MKLSAWTLLRSRIVEVYPLFIDDWQWLLQFVVLGDEVLPSLDDGQYSLTSLSFSYFPLSGTLGISSVGNLRFCTGCCLGWRPDQDSKESSLLGESLRRLLSQNFARRFEVLSSWYKLDS